MADKNPYLADFADRLFRLREKKGVSAREMSFALGQSHNYINGLENQNGFPKMSSFFYICEYLGVTPSEFFDYTDTDPLKTTELYREIKRLDGTSQAYFLQLARDVNARPK